MTPKLTEAEFIAGNPLPFTGLDGRRYVATYCAHRSPPFLRIEQDGETITAPIMAEHEARTFYQHSGESRR